jgi:hypothetical protein
VGRARAPQARASWEPGTLYAINGVEGWFYYGQVSAQKGAIGFLRYRTLDIESRPEIVLQYPLISRIGIAWPSLGRALRAGRWHFLGRAPLHPDLANPYGIALCPVGTNNVQIWVYQDRPGQPATIVRTWHTRIDDPEIQNFEVASAWDAEHHIPQRLKADFGAEEGDWHVTGPVWRHRKVKLEYARRFPDQPWHQLPTD